MPELDLSEFETPPRPCPVIRALGALSAEDRPKFEFVLTQPSDRYGNEKIAERFRARDISCGRESIARHRSGECPCGRGA